MRSLLIALLIALPAALGTSVALAAGTATDTANRAGWAGQADAAYFSNKTGSDTDTRAKLAAGLPPGTAIARPPFISEIESSITHDGRGVSGLTTWAIDPTSTVTADTYTLVEGTWPTGTNQVALAARDMAALDISLGDTVTVGWDYVGTDFASTGLASKTGQSQAVVTGVADDPRTYAPKGYVIESTNGPIPALQSISPGLGNQESDYLVKFPPEAGIDSGDLPTVDGFESVSSENGDERLLPFPWYLHVDAASLSLAAICLGLGLLVIVLLAGAGISIAARRMQRDIALMLIVGASARHVRLMVLSLGAILGVVGAAIGVLVGWVGFLISRVPAEDLLMMRLDGPVSGWRIVAVVALAATCAGLASASRPAKAQSQLPPAAALRGSMRTSAAPPRVPWKSLGMIVGGTVVATLSCLSIAAADMPPLAGVQLVIAAAAFATALVGLVAALPQLMAVLGVLAARMPLTLRFAMRDASRSRHRTVPTGGAILAATVLAVPALVGFTSFTAYEESHFISPVPQGFVALAPEPLNSASPGSRTLVARIGQDTQITGKYEPITPAASPSATYLCDPPSQVYGYPDNRCSAGQVIVAEPAYVSELIAASGGAAPPIEELTEQMDKGSLVILRNAPGVNGYAADSELPDNPPGLAVARSYMIPDRPNDVQCQHGCGSELAAPRATGGIVVDIAQGSQLAAGSFISPQGWARLEPTLAPAPANAVINDDGTPDVAPARTQTVLTIDEPLTPAQVAQLRDSSATEFDVYTAYQAPSSLVLGGTLAVILLVAITATIISSSLSAWENRPDLDTLSAIGATAGQRRRVTSAQSGLVAGIGAVAGLAFGSLVAVSVVIAVKGDSALVLPWIPMFLILVSVPTTAALIGLAAGGSGRRSSVDHPNRRQY